jgi:hypothetical protein
VRYALRGHRPVIALGARAAHKSEYLRWSERVALRRLGALLRGQRTPAWEAGGITADPRYRAGAEIQVSQRARLLGEDHLKRVRRKGHRRGRHEAR